MAMNSRLLRPIASKATAFDPLSISGLHSWWDAADASTVTLDSGRVASMTDKSGGGNTLANSTSGSTQPDYVTNAINGRNVVRFVAASSQRLSRASSTAYNFVHNGSDCFIAAVFSVGTTADPLVVYPLFGNGIISNGVIGHHVYMDDRSFTNEALGVMIGGGGTTTASLLASNRLAVQSPSVIVMAIDADNATASQRISGKTQRNTFSSSGSGAASASSASRNFFVGTDGNAASFLQGDFCELLIYNALLTASQQDLVYNYLALKWGVT